MHIRHSITATQREQGFTLVELLIVVAISGFVSLALFLVYRSQMRAYSAQEQVVELQQSVRAGIDILVRDIRMAGYNPHRSATVGFTAANATTMTFSMVVDADGVDNDGDGTVDELNELKSISYQLYDSMGDGDLDLGRNDGGLQAASENIDAIEFYYTMADGSQTTTPATLANIRAVQVSILARASNRDPDFTNSNTYIPASGLLNWDINGATAGTGNPPNDNFRRRLVITTIQCRNMGF